MMTDDIAANLRSYRPDICWQEQHLGQGTLDLTSEVLDASSLDDQLCNRLDAVTRRVSGLGVSSQANRLAHVFTEGLIV